MAIVLWKYSSVFGDYSRSDGSTSPSPGTDRCLKPRACPSPDYVRQVRENASQAVFIRYLNVTTSLVSQWGRGEKRLRGAFAEAPDVGGAERSWCGRLVRFSLLRARARLRMGISAWGAPAIGIEARQDRDPVLRGRRRRGPECRRMRHAGCRTARCELDFGRYRSLRQLATCDHRGPRAAARAAPPLR